MFPGRASTSLSPSGPAPPLGLVFRDPAGGRLPATLGWFAPALGVHPRCGPFPAGCGPSLAHRLLKRRASLAQGSPAASALRCDPAGLDSFPPQSKKLHIFLPSRESHVQASAVWSCARHLAGEMRTCRPGTEVSREFSLCFQWPMQQGKSFAP